MLTTVLDESETCGGLLLFLERTVALKRFACSGAMSSLYSPQQPISPLSIAVGKREVEVMANDDERFMRKAIEVATEEGSDPSLSPIGCVIVLDGVIIASAHNRVVEDHDATAHAEIVAMRAAGRAFDSGELRGATLYSTLQPCGMCTMASIWSKVGRIVFGAGRDDVHKMYFEARHVDTLNFIRDAYRDDLEVTAGVRREDCVRLYYQPDDDPPEQEQGNL